ncbi:MAG: hypothetical protein Q9181_005584 [Wetmoreana brouardii]
MPRMPALKTTGSNAKRPAPSQERSKKTHNVAKPSKSTALKGFKAVQVPQGDCVRSIQVLRSRVLEWLQGKPEPHAPSLVSNSTKRSSIQESNASKIELSEDDPYLFSLLLEFLYTQTYTPDNSASSKRVDAEDPKSIPKVHISLYALGDKYAIPALCHEAVNQLRARFKSNPNAAEALRCVPWMYENATANDSSLRDLAIKQLALHSTAILEDRKLTELMLKLVHEVQELREDIALGFLEANSDCGMMRMSMRKKKKVEKEKNDLAVSWPGRGNWNSREIGNL